VHVAGTPGKLISCRSGKDRRHQLRRGLTGAGRLASKLAVDGRWERNIGNDDRSRRHHIGGELLLQDRIELPHAAPFLGGRQIRHVCDRRTVGRDEDIRQLSIRDVGLLDLQLVDEIVYFVGNLDAVPGSHQLDLDVREKIGNCAGAHLRTVETRGVAPRRQAAENTAQD